MPFCDQCGAENPDMARFCDQCGNPLTPVAQPAAPAQPATPIGASNQCAHCGAPFIPGEAFCDSCGMPLSVSEPAASPPPAINGVPPQQNYPAPQPYPVQPEQPATPGQPPANTQPTVMPDAAPAAPASPPAAAPLHAFPDNAYVSIPAHNLTLEIPTKESVLLGRSDPVSGAYVDVDLGPHGGLESGVGRRHVHLFVQHGRVFVEDLNSTNGTFLNGRRLASRVPQEIASGDELRLGAMVLRVQY